MSTADLLSGKFADTDPRSALIISPENYSAVSNEIVFLWMKSEGAVYYKLSVAADDLFSDMIIYKKTFDASCSAVIPYASTFYWKVETVYPDAVTVSETGCFSILDGSIHVYADSPETAENGSRKFPFKSIKKGLAAAAVRGISTVLTAEGVYSEEVNMKPGVSVYGGYDGISWERDALLHETIIQSATDYAVKYSSAVTEEYSGSTAIDGFTIQGGEADMNTAVYSAGGHINAANNIIRCGNGGATIGIYVSSSTGGTIRNNEFDCGNSPDSVYIAGVYTEDSHVVVRNNFFRLSSLAGHTVSQIMAVYQRSSTAEIENNIVHIYSEGQAVVIAIMLNGSSPLIKNNTLIAGTTGGTGYHTNIINNANGGAPDLLSNIMFITAGNVKCGIYRNGLTSNPYSIINNIITGSMHILQYHYHGDNYLHDGNSSTSEIEWTRFFHPGSSPDLVPSPAEPYTGGGGVSGNLSLSSTQTVMDIFAVMPAPSDIDSFEIKINGMADIDSIEGWSGGDIGADASAAGRIINIQ